MKELQAFKNEQFGQLRVIEIDGKVYFVAIDAAKSLGYTNPHVAIRNHCKGVVKTNTPTNGGHQEVKIIPEGDLYRLIVKAADQSINLEIKERAEQFEKWIFDVVIPQIRLTGQYQSINIQNISVEQALEILRLIKTTENYKMPAVSSVLKCAGIEIDFKISSDSLVIISDYLAQTSLKGQYSATEIYNDYVQWCIKQGLMPYSKTKFGRTISERGVKKGRTSKKRYYILR